MTSADKVPPRLIVSADDFGLTKGINEEILRCLEDGIVTSVSIMACGCAVDEAIRLAQGFPPEIGLGVHLTLDSEIPVASSDNIPSLATGNGRFLARSQLLIRLLKGQIRGKDVFSEWSSQIEKATAAGLHPDHLDGHGHIHVFPTLLPVVIELARHYCIPAVRLPKEPVWPTGGLKRLPGGITLGLASKIARWRFKNRLRHPDFMFGFSNGGCYEESRFLRDLAYLREGEFAEAVFHPGPSHIDVPSYKSWQYKWSVDSRTLRSDRVKDFITKRGINLATFKDLN